MTTPARRPCTARDRATPTSPESTARASERAERVQAALLTLSPKLRAVAVLRYVEGLSYDELAEAMNCSLGTIKSRLNRAHTALQAALADLGGEPEDDDSA